MRRTHATATLPLALTLALPLAFAAPAAAATLEDVAKAMGAGKVTSIQYEGAGMFHGVGQSFRPGLPWPKFNLVRATRSYDYAKGILANDLIVTQAENPPRGGSQQPLTGEQRRANGIAGDKAWTVAGAFTLAAPALTSALQHDLWTSPHGIVLAAIQDKAALTPAPGGATFEVTRPGRFKARATVDAQNRVVKVESWLGNPVLGDMAVIATYSDYTDKDGVAVPMKIMQSMGGHPVLELAVSGVTINGAAITVPSAISAPPGEVKIEKAADGVWFVAGASHHSVAIEMRDHVILFECPLGDARTLAVIEAVKKTIPGKPIRTAVNTHHHFDHSGGLRACAAEGATIVTHAMNKPYFETAYAAPRSLQPDALTKKGGKAEFVPVEGKHVLTDGTRTLEIHHVKDNWHNDGLLIGYLPKEKILLVADAFSPREPITAVPATLSPFTTNLWANLQQLKLDVETVLPIHGRMVKVEELRLAAGVK